MRIFIDTANLDQIREAASWGILDGVTTNPSLASKEIETIKNMTLHSFYKEMCALVDGPVSLETVSTDAAGMIKEAHELAKIADNAAVKVPMTEEGIKACSALTKNGIMVNITLVFSANQALLAAKAGATFVSPFIGRIDDAGNDGMAVLEEIVDIYYEYGFDTEIIAASLRHPIHVVQSALIGADIATIPYDVLKKMFRHPLTDTGIAKFLEDYKKIEGK
jgi:transaldolase